MFRDNKTYYFYPHHKSEKYGYSNGLYVSSYKPEEHEEWPKDKNNFFRCKDRSKSPVLKESTNNDATRKGLVPIDKVKHVLTTSQPRLNDVQVEAFIQAASKE